MIEDPTNLIRESSASRLPEKHSNGFKLGWTATDLIQYIVTLSIVVSFAPLIDLFGLRNQQEGKSNQLAMGLGVLRRFYWFCSKENRDDVEAIEGDLKKDIKKMRREKRSELFIQSVILWHVTTTILTVLWGGFRRFLGAALPVEKLIRKFMGH